MGRRGGGGDGDSQPPLIEDCISIDPTLAQVQKVSGGWKIVQGDLWLKDFGEAGEPEKEARTSLRLWRKPASTGCLRRAARRVDDVLPRQAEQMTSQPVDISQLTRESD